MLDVCEELMKFTLLTRGRADYLVDRYSERKEREPESLKAVGSSACLALRKTHVGRHRL
jgi:arsenic resistance protein ArsH